MKKRTKIIIGVIAVIFLLGIFSTVNDDETQKTETKQTEAKSKETKPKKDKAKKDKSNKDKPITIEVNKEATSVDYTAKVQRVKVKDNILTVVFDWENQSDWNPTHFNTLGYIQVEQNGEPLEDVSSDRRYKQIKRGSFDVYDLEYELIDDSEVNIKIASTNEHDGSEENIKVKLQ